MPFDPLQSFTFEDDKPKSGFDPSQPFEVEDDPGIIDSLKSGMKSAVEGFKSFASAHPISGPKPESDLATQSRFAAFVPGSAGVAPEAIVDADTAPNLTNSVARGASSEGPMMGAEGAYRMAASAVGSADLVKEQTDRITQLQQAKQSATDVALRNGLPAPDSQQIAGIDADIMDAQNQIKAAQTPGTSENLSVSPAGQQARKDLATNLTDIAAVANQQRQEVREALPVDEDFQKTYPGMIAQGLGQLITTPAYAVPGLGAAMSVTQLYQEGYDDAKQSGATDEQADSAARKYVIAAGPMEVLADKLMVGKVLKAMHGQTKTIGEAVKEIAKQGVQEGATEGGQQLWLNAVAKQLEGYDPNRPLTKDVADSALVGAAVGVGGTTAGQAAGIVSQSKETREAVKNEATRATVERSDQVADTLENSYSPLSAAAQRQITPVIVEKTHQKIDEVADEHEEATLKDFEDSVNKLEKGDSEYAPAPGSAQNGSSAVTPEEPIVEQANDRPTDNTENLEAPTTGEAAPEASESSQGILEPAIQAPAEEASSTIEPNDQETETAIPSEQAATELASAEVEQPAASAEKVNEPTTSKPVEAGNQSTPEAVPEPAETTKSPKKEGEFNEGDRITINGRPYAFIVKEVLPQSKIEKELGVFSFNVQKEGGGPIRAVTTETDKIAHVKEKPAKQTKKTTPNEKSKPVNRGALQPSSSGSKPEDDGGRGGGINVSLRDSTEGNSGGTGGTEIGRPGELREIGERSLGEYHYLIDYERLANLESSGVKVTYDTARRNAAFHAKDGTITFNLNPNSFKSKKPNPARLRKIAEEEMVHSAQLVLWRNQWEEAGKNPLDFKEFVRKKARVLHDDLIQAYNAAPAKDKPALERSLVAAFNIYFHGFSEERPMITSINELISHINDSDAAGSSNGDLPSSLSYIFELSRMLHQQQSDGQISEETMKGFLEKIKDWVRKAFENFREIVTAFEENGAFSKTQVAQFLQDFKRVYDGKKPSDKFISSTEEASIEKMDKFFAKRDEDDEDGGEVPDFALTPEQHKLVNDNQNLAYSIANRYRNIPKADYDDLKHEAVLAMGEAAKNFNPDKGAFSQIASVYINNKLKSLYTKQLRRSVRDGGSLNEPLPSGDEKIEGVPAPVEKPSGDVDAISKIQKVVAALPERERRILEMKAEGMSLREISEGLKPDYTLSHERINQLLKQTAAQLQVQLRSQGITSREDVFPESSERTQYLPEKFQPEDETRMVEQAVESGLYDQAETAPQDTTEDNLLEEESVAAAKEEDEGTFAKNEDNLQAIIDNKEKGEPDIRDESDLPLEDIPEKVPTQVMGQKFTVEGRQRLDKPYLQAANDHAKAIFDEAGLDVEPFEFIDSRKELRKLWKLKDDFTQNEEGGQKLLELLRRELTNQKQDGPNNSVLMDSVRGKMRTAEAFTQNLRNQLFSTVQSEASMRGINLRALAGIGKSVTDVAQHVPVYLHKVYSDQFGGDNIEKVMNGFQKSLHEIFSEEDINKFLGNPERFNDALEKLLHISKKRDTGSKKGLLPTMKAIMDDILNTPFYSETDIYDRFKKRLEHDFNITPELSTKAVKYLKFALQKKFNKAKEKALEKTLKSLSPDDRKAGIKKNSPIWQKIVHAVNAGNFDTPSVLQALAHSKGWKLPSAEDIAKMKDLAGQEQKLRELTPEEIESAGGDEDKLAKLQQDKEAATLNKRALLKKEMERMWAKFANPDPSWNPLKGWGVEQRKVRAAMINEGASANLLATAGFGTRQTIDMATQLLLHLPTRAVSAALVRRGNDLAAGNKTQFIKDTYEAMGDAIHEQTQALKAAIPTFVQTMKGKTAARNVDALMSSVSVFDKTEALAKKLWASDNPASKAAALALRTVNLIRFSYRYAQAMDMVSGNGVEAQEMRQQTITQLRENGMSPEDARRNADMVMGDMRGEWRNAVSRAQNIFDAIGHDASKMEIETAAYEILKNRQYQRMNDVGLDGMKNRDYNFTLKNTIGWNEGEFSSLSYKEGKDGGPAGIGGAGGVVALAGKGARMATEYLGIPFPPALFANAMGIATNRALTFTPAGYFPSLFKGSPWFHGEENIAQRKVEASVGTAMIGMFVSLAAAGLIKVVNGWPDDKEERQRFTREGHVPNTVEFYYGPGKFIPVSMSVGPLSNLRAGLAGIGAIQKMQEATEKHNVKERAKAEAKGLKYTDKGLSASSLLYAAVIAAQQAAIGGRTAGGAINQMSDQGEVNLKKAVAGLIQPLVPFLPAYSQTARMAGANIDPKKADLSQLLFPVAGSGAERVNALGESLSNPDAMQRVTQSLTGGTYPFPVSTKDANKEKPYRLMYNAGYMPPTLNEGQHFSVNGEWRALNRKEVMGYYKAFGNLFKQEAEKVEEDQSPEVIKDSLEDINTTSRAEALESVGVSSGN